MRETLQVLNDMRRDGVIGEYAIGGAIAAGMWLEPFTTKDLKVFVEFPVVPGGSGLLSLSAIYEYLSVRRYEPSGQFIDIGEWPVEFLHPTHGLEREAIDRAAELTVEGVNIRVMSPEYLVPICLRTGRLKDDTRILAFLEQKSVDLPKLHSVLERFGLAEQWDKFLRRYPPREHDPRNPDKERLRQERRNATPTRKASLMNDLRVAGEAMRKARRTLR